jgi:hypothetical protein
VSGISGPFESGCLSLNHSENHENINNNNTNESNNNNNDSSNDQNGHLQALLLSNYDKHTYNPTYAPGIVERNEECLLNINYNMAVDYKIYFHTKTDHPERYKYKMESIRNIFMTRKNITYKAEHRLFVIHSKAPLIIGVEITFNVMMMMFT